MSIVEAVAAFAPPTDRGRRIEAAMSSAALEAYSKGITDPAVIRQMMADAAQAAKETL
jgi:hypothetical protein